MDSPRVFPSDTCPEETSSLVDIALRLLRQCEAGNWIARNDEFWCTFEPPDYRARPQGWKLHVSATPLSACEVLTRAGGVLFRHKCAFKFAGTIERVAELVSEHYDRAGAGKFITAYPDN